MVCRLQRQAPAPAFYTAEPPQRSAAKGSGGIDHPAAVAAPVGISASPANAAVSPHCAGDDTRCDHCAALQQLRPRVLHLVTPDGSLNSSEGSDRAAASRQRLARLKMQGRGAAAAEQSSRAVDCGASPIVVLPATARLQEAVSLAATPSQHSSMSMQQQQQQQQCRLGISYAVGMAAAHGGSSVSQISQLAAGSTAGSPPQQARPAWVVTGRELALRLHRRAELEAAAAAANKTVAAAQPTAPLQQPAPAAAAASRTANAHLLPGSPAQAAAELYGTPAPASAASSAERGRLLPDSPASAAAGLCNSPAPAATAAGLTGCGQLLPGSPAPAAAGLHGSPAPAAAVVQTPHLNPLFEAADAADTVDATDTQPATSVAAQQQHDSVQV